MSVGYRSVQWNPNKVRYDLAAVGLVLAYLAAFVGVGSVVRGGDHAVSPPILLMRALGTAALLLLHVVLAIGPLCRLDRRFLPLLYNRRHLGVLTFLLGLGHAVVTVGFYHGFGEVSAPLSVLTSSARAASLPAFPFEWLGLAGLLVLFVMAATSHDFWLANLSPRVWKATHMAVYPAYAVLVLHVALGAIQSERSAVYPALLGAGVVTLTALHLAAGRREARRDRDAAPVAADDAPWVDACGVGDLRDGRGRVVCVPGGERVALFRQDGRVSAISNVCAHQGGPLGEGRIVDGCVTCPWHGFQYRAADGRAPPPFTERLPTYRVRVAGGRVLIDPRPLPPGTPVEPAVIEREPTAHADPTAEVTHA